MSDVAANRYELLVAGMTCSHCVSAVREELGAIGSVESVDIELGDADRPSRATVRARRTLSDEELTEAVAEAGYALAAPIRS
ncbi:MAG TPA: heavy metal-associated domain-containing protein [Acidimicrobiales bacterium]|nr:heavy metal-associated domain-containing protein [Acidimicrobiales bacterium]